MKARDAVGQRITAIEQNRFWNDHMGSMCVALKRIVLENGTVLTATVEEMDGDYAVELHAHKPKNRELGY